MDAYDAALQRLQKRWQIVVALYALGLAGLALILRSQLPAWQTLLWLGMSGLSGIYILGYLYIRLPQNTRSGALDLLPSLGPGTALSLLGGWLLAAMGGFILLPRPDGWLGWLPASLFILALMADLGDGFLARRAQQVTLLGRDLDMTLDGLGVLLAALLVVRWQQWPLWFLIVGLARYLFIWGLAWRKNHALPTRELNDSVIRRLLAGMQRGFLFVAMWPIMPAWLATATGLAFVFPFLLNFTYDWLVASAVIDDQLPDFRAAMQTWRRWAYGPVALALRLLAAVATGLALWQAYAAQDVFLAGLARVAGLPPAAGALLLLLGVILTPLLLLGVAPRATATLLYLPVGFLLAADVSLWPGLIAFYGLTAVILLGPGSYALWQPEAAFFTKRLGG